VLLAVARAFRQSGVRTLGTVYFVGDVGEEGLGDLRGVRHLFTQGRYRDKIEAFITVDSPQMNEIVVGGVGSKRYSVRFRGPGGHSFKAFGIVNPMYAMAQAIVELGRALRLDMIAEGIETRDQADWFRALGIQLGQGFHFARPMPNPDIDRYLRRVTATRGDGGQTRRPGTPLPAGPRLAGAGITDVLGARKAAG